MMNGGTQLNDRWEQSVNGRFYMSSDHCPDQFHSTYFRNDEGGFADGTGRAGSRAWKVTLVRGKGSVCSECMYLMCSRY